MAAIRQLAERNATADPDGENLRDAWEESIQPVIDLIRTRFERLKLKDQPVCKQGIPAFNSVEMFKFPHCLYSSPGLILHFLIYIKNNLQSYV